jgi:hypothetical protein
VARAVVDNINVQAVTAMDMGVLIACICGLLIGYTFTKVHDLNHETAIYLNIKIFEN